VLALQGDISMRNPGRVMIAPPRLCSASPSASKRWITIGGNERTGPTQGNKRVLLLKRKVYRLMAGAIRSAGLITWSDRSPTNLAPSGSVSQEAQRSIV